MDRKGGSDMDAVLRVRELTKSFKGHQVLRGVSMEIPKGSIYGLVGRNGEIGRAHV